jgi:hypothetical protein
MVNSEERLKIIRWMPSYALPRDEYPERATRTRLFGISCFNGWLRREFQSCCLRSSCESGINPVGVGA